MERSNLDPAVVRYALAIPVRWKIRGPESIEKWPLRIGLEGVLPDEVIWREKAKFWEGAGSVKILEDHANQVISDDEFNAERDLSKDFRVRSKEELLYYRKFKRFFLGIKYRWLRLVVRSMDKWFSLASKTDWRRH